LKNGGHVAISGVTIDARGGLQSSLNSASVKPAIVGGMRVGVKFCAAKVRQTLTGRVTTLTFEDR
jgi:hypothetical protein